MDAINWLLINIANAFWWLWDLLGTVFGAIWSLLDTILNPILSPILSVLNPICTVVGDGVYAVLGLLPIWLGLTVVSAVAGVVMLVAFGYLSNQRFMERNDGISECLPAEDDPFRYRPQSRRKKTGRFNDVLYLMSPEAWKHEIEQETQAKNS